MIKLVVMMSNGNDEGVADFKSLNEAEEYLGRHGFDLSGPALGEGGEIAHYTHQGGAGDATLFYHDFSTEEL